MTAPVFDEPMYSLAVYPGSGGWFYMVDSQRQAGKHDRAYMHYLPEGSYMISSIVTGPTGMDLYFNSGDDGTPTRRIKLAPEGEDGTTRSGSTTISITAPNGKVGFHPHKNFDQDQLDNPIGATVQIVKIPSYEETP